MSASDKTVTLLGATAVVTDIHVYPQVDGTYLAIVNGTCLDSTGKKQNLDIARQVFPSNTVALSSLFPPALSILLAANGLGS